MLGDVGFVGVVRGFLVLCDEERMLAYASDLLDEICGRGAAAYEQNALDLLMDLPMRYYLVSYGEER